jgi:hypothetical protein
MSSPYDSGNGGMVSEHTLLGQQSMRESDVHTYIRLRHHKHLLWAYPLFSPSGGSQQVNKEGLLDFRGNGGAEVPFAGAPVVPTVIASPAGPYV